MAVYVVTGKLGAGKTLVAVGKIKDRIIRGCKVATNLDLQLHKLEGVGKFAKSPRVMRIPDKPTLEDLEFIGVGNTSYDESKNGLLVLDECGTWFNSRSWADKSRQDVINWFLHARKMGWDIIFLIQDVSIMDKQARLALAEHVVYCRRLDRVNIPFIGGIYNAIIGGKLPLPKFHLGIVKYGDSQNSLTVDKWLYSGKGLYAAYNTKQIFTDNYDCGVYSYLTPYLSHGRYFKKLGVKGYMKLTRIYFKKYSRILFFVVGGIVGSVFSYSSASDENVDATVMMPQLNSEYNIADFKIYSSSRFGREVNYTFIDSKGVKISQAELINNGYQVIYYNACKANIKKDLTDEMVHC